MSISKFNQIQPKTLSKVALLIMACLLAVAITMPAMAATDEGGHGEGGGAKGWVKTDTYRVMNFAVLAIALFFILKKPLTNALNGRIEGIRSELGELEAKKEAAQKELTQYNEKLAALDKEAEQIMVDYVRQGEEAKARILEEAKQAAVKLEDQAKRNIDAEFKQTKEKIHAEILEKAMAKAEAIVQEKITSDDQERLVDDYLEKVVAS